MRAFYPIPLSLCVIHNQLLLFMLYACSFASIVIYGKQAPINWPSLTTLCLGGWLNFRIWVQLTPSKSSPWKMHLYWHPLNFFILYCVIWLIYSRSVMYVLFLSFYWPWSHRIQLCMCMFKILSPIRNLLFSLVPHAKYWKTSIQSLK
jgi:hypothetical protein